MVGREAQAPPLIVLLILDGWGVVPPGAGNAIWRAKTPVMDDLIKRYPALVLQAASESVGLPWGEMGNSEVGHYAIGTGRLTYHHLLKINQSIWDGAFFKNKAFLKAIQHVKKNNSALHLIGMVSSGGVHSYIDHLYALLDLAKSHKIKKLYLHCILDGRDVAHNSARGFIGRLQERLRSLGIGAIATMHGRYYAMDRDRHWERTGEVYRAIVRGESKFIYRDPVQAIDFFYQQKIYDEHVKPVVVTGKGGESVAKIFQDDAVIFFNFRADRMRQLTTAFTKETFTGFERGPRLKNLQLVSFTEYNPSFNNVTVAWRTPGVRHPLAEVISRAGWKQLHIAETEKYAHVTYFFNGGQKTVYPGEDHILIPSLRDASYDEVPEMSVEEINQRVLQDIANEEHRFIIVNFANADMVGHTANLKATIMALETVDKQVGLLCQAVLSKKGILFITADHGNAETLVNVETGQLQKEHTDSPVPFIIVSSKYEGKTLGFPDAPNGDLSLVTPSGLLSDVAPTILKICGLPKPKEMTGRSLV